MKLGQLLGDRDAGWAASAGVSATFSGFRAFLPRRARVRAGRVEWTANDGADVSRAPPRGTIDGACLDRFVRLAGDDARRDDRVAAFVRRYGTLSLGDDGMPVDSPRFADEGPAAVGLKVAGRQLLMRMGWYQEPLAAWLAWARYAHALLVLGIELRGGDRIIPDVRLRRCGFDLGPPDVEIPDDSPALTTGHDGRVALSDLGYTLYHRLWPWRVVRDLDSCATVEQQRSTLAAELSFRWLRHGDHALRLDWTDPMPRATVDPSAFGDFGEVHWCLPTLAGQLLATLAGDTRKQYCRDCQLPYTVQRRRENGRCGACGRAEASRRVQRSKAKRRLADAETATPITTPKLPQSPRTAADGHGRDGGKKGE